MTAPLLPPPLTMATAAAALAVALLEEACTIGFSPAVTPWARVRTGLTTDPRVTRLIHTSEFLFLAVSIYLYSSTYVYSTTTI